jgi:5-methylcytosine-specific restriction endonuclease McrA
MDANLEARVRARARFRCEYCRFPEEFAELPFQLDHIIARQHGGRTEPDNLALACCYCNRHKGPNLSGVDPVTGRVVRLFSPRSARWEENFGWDGAVLVGLTPEGRATIATLRINQADRVAVRSLFAG